MLTNGIDFRYCFHIKLSQRILIQGKRFAAIRGERYLTQEEFADSLEMSPANIRRLEQTEIGGMQVKNFRRLAALLDIAPDELRRKIGAPPADSSPEQVKTRTPEEGALWGPKFPIGFKPITRRDVTEVAHYHGVSAARTEDRTDAPRGKALVPAGAQRRFAVTVDGDCMEPNYRDGEVVIFSVDAAEREGIVDGKNYFIQFVEGENTFKRLFLDPDNRELVILKCWNEQYKPRVVERARIKLLARAVYRLTPDE